jgi:hypothetical protein
MQSGELQLLRNCILNYLQDETVRVSVLLKSKSQNPDGRFVIPTYGPVAAGKKFIFASAFTNFLIHFSLTTFPIGLIIDCFRRYRLILCNKNKISRYWSRKNEKKLSKPMRIISVNFFEHLLYLIFCMI